MTDHYFDLGSHVRQVSTSSPRAQAWFDRGLNWAYAFNFEEAVRCFERAANHDPNCATAYWGIAYASGPNYNKAWRLFDQADFDRTTRFVGETLARARALAARATPLERALIEALPARFGASTLPAAQRQSLNLSYVEAMRPVHRAHPDDLDVAALFVDALMCVSPRRLWDLTTGKPEQ
jgi:tetratricopeptide (TPR) repeat protein